MSTKSTLFLKNIFIQNLVSNVRGNFINLFDNIITNHKDIKGIKAICKFDKNIEITVNKNNNKNILWVFNNKTNRFINNKTNKYKYLIDKFKEVSLDIYYKENYLYITLKNEFIKNRLPKTIGYCRVSTK